LFGVVFSREIDDRPWLVPSRIVGICLYAELAVNSRAKVSSNRAVSCWSAWGKRRHPDGSDDPAGVIASQTNRGFTGHEELDQVGLVHMSGRVYDPLLARFGTPDPFTENPFSTQGWNRYSYFGNNGLTVGY
jgi:RHS repeat-associated protein